MTVDGRPTGASTGYAGHDVEVFVPALTPAAAGAAPTPTPIFLRLPVSDDGKFSLTLPRP